MLKEQPIDWAALFEIYSRRPRAAVHSAMFRHLPEAVRAYLQEVDAPDRAIRVRALRDALKAYSIDQVAEALEALPADRRANPANLELKLYALRPENRTPEPIAEDYTPLVVAAYAPDSALYDQLLPTRMEGGDDEMKSPLLEEQCKALKLGSVSRVYTQIDFESREQFLTDLFAEELKIREDNRNRRRLKRAGFPPDQNARGVLLGQHRIAPRKQRENT